MGRMEELFYELYASSKRHDSWQRQAMIRELRNLLKQPLSMKMKGNRSDSMVNKIGIPEDQVLKDEELGETEVATDPIETEHETVNLVPEAQEEESIPQSKVPIANSEILKSIEPGKVDLGLEKLEHVVMNENLEQEWDQKNVKVMVIDGVVSLGKHVKLFDCVALPLITPPSSVLQVFSHANRSVWEPGGFHCVLVQENHVQHERNKAEGVGFFVQRIGVASEMENQAVTAGVVYGKRSDRVWEPGGLPTKLNMWDWTEKTRHSFLQSEKFQPFHQNQVFDELEVVESKSSTNPMLGSMLKRHHKRQQVRKLRLSPQPWLFKFKQKLIRLQIRDKEFQIAMPLAPKILKVHHMPNYLVIVEAAAPIYPTVEYLSQFSSKVGFDKEHSSSSLRANQIWDPGGKFSTSEATCEQPRKHINTTEVFSSTAEATEENFIAFCTNIILLNLEVKVFSKGKICYR